PVAAILLSGDVAYAGNRDEFRFARTWLDELCKRCGAKVEDIFVCPGNHDVARDIAGGTVVQSLHQSIKSAGPLAVEPTIRGMLTDPKAAHLLYESLDEYNLFAVQFFCDLLPPNRTVASRDLELN